MADNVAVTPGVGSTIATDEVTDGTLGTVQVQYVKLMDGVLNSTNKAGVTASGEQYVAFLSPQHAIVDSGTVTISGTVDASAATVTTKEAKGATSTLSRVGASATSVQLLAAAATRTYAILVNESSSAMRVKYGTTASSTSYTYRLLAGDTLEMYGWTGRIDGIWDSATGTAQLTEITP